MVICWNQHKYWKDNHSEGHLYLVGFFIYLFLISNYHLSDQYYQFSRNGPFCHIHLSDRVELFAVSNEHSTVSILWTAFGAILTQFELSLEPQTLVQNLSADPVFFMKVWNEKVEYIVINAGSSRVHVVIFLNFTQHFCHNICEVLLPCHRAHTPQFLVFSYIRIL